MKKIIYKILKRLLPDKILISRIKMLDKKQYRGGGIEYIVLSVGHACTLKFKNC